jgi:hypothetical protein
MAHGFEGAMLGKLLLDGLANAWLEDMRAGRRQMKVTWVRVTAAGRRAIAE